MAKATAGQIISKILLAVLVVGVLPPLFQYGTTRCWYSLYYAVDPEHVTVGHKPHNCDYDWAPVGNKGCRYNKEVTTIRTARTAYGADVMSYDEGKTWQFTHETGGTTQVDAHTISVASVDISWFYEKDE